MEPTARIKFGVLAVVIGLVTAAAVAGQYGVPMMGSVANSPSDPQDVRRQCDDLLTRARQAMDEGDLSAAEQLLKQAESLNVSYPMMHMGDTPKRLRGELEHKLSGATHVADPFNVGRSGAPATEKAGSDRLLLSARRALAMEQVRQAEQLTREAQALRLTYSSKDDTPDRVLALIEQYKRLKSDEAAYGHTPDYLRRKCDMLLWQANGLRIHKDFDEASRLAQKAVEMNVPYQDFARGPQALLQHIAQERAAARASNYDRNVQPAGGPVSHGAPETALYRPRMDNTRNELASTEQSFGPSPYAPATNGFMPTASAPAPTHRVAMGPIGQGAPAAGAPSNQAYMLFQQGNAALEQQDRQSALRYFRQAAELSHQLDQQTLRQVQDKIQLLDGGSTPSARPAPGAGLVRERSAPQQAALEQYRLEVADARREAARMVEADIMRAKDALALLESKRETVAGTDLDPVARKMLTDQLDRDINRVLAVIDQNAGEIQLNTNNERVLAEIEADQAQELQLQGRLKDLVDEYNQLLEEERIPEALEIAKRAREVAPDHPITQQLYITATMIYRTWRNTDLAERKEQGFWNGMDEVEQSAVYPFSGNNPIVYNQGTWEQVRNRGSFSEILRGQRSQADMLIEQRLRSVTVRLSYPTGAPFAAVINDLQRLADINIMIDPEGLAQVGAGTNDPVTVDLPNELILRDALKTILEQKRLGYTIRNGVLHITSESLSRGPLTTETYYVGDLVIPIPNFLPNQNMGMAGAYARAMATANFRGASALGAGAFGQAFGPPAVTTIASHSGTEAHAAIDPVVLGQVTGGGMTPGGNVGFGMGGGGMSGMPMSGPGGAGSGSQADFESVIELIQTTVAPSTWQAMGGEGTIEQFDPNLSLVIRTTEEVHEEIAELLEQLRKMQDLQVTVEVRFITLNDNYFERIGVDFDFDIDSGIDRNVLVGAGTGQGNNDDDNANNDVQLARGESATVGLAAPGVFTADLDIPFTQNSFGLAVPQFGGFDVTAGAQMGFALLSDIEAFFFIAAAQGDSRSNVLQAPKVTLFNGQMGMVADQSETPFVTSTIPVVGDFAAAQQPVIMVLSEGTFLTVQAVVTDDRRYVRLTVIPFFSRIEDVETFTFDGTDTTTVEESEDLEGLQDEDRNDNSITRNEGAVTQTRSGTSVQLPTYAYLNVSTTVSVPDGGTVLLGGVKRLSEGRNEFGVPLINKIPYVNRLFQNVSVGRETQSLMMMVTPRIIIQEEEEEKLGLTTN